MSEIVVITGSVRGGALAGRGRSSRTSAGSSSTTCRPRSSRRSSSSPAARRGIERLALVVRPAARRAAAARRRACAPTGHRVRSLYLEARRPMLVRRYERTRRQHPLSTTARRAARGDRAERDLLEPVKERPTSSSTRSDLNVHQLQDRAGRRVRASEGSTPAADRGRDLRLQARAAARRRHRDGLRFLPNPHWVEALRPLTGLDPPVRDYVLEQAVTASSSTSFERCCSTAAARLRRPRARATSRSRSAAPAAATARWRSPRRSPRGFAAHGIAARTSRTATSDRRS